MTSTEFKNKIVSFSPRLYPMVARMLQSDDDARDAVQDIMLKLWKNRRKLNNHPNISGYIFLTARNHCLDIIKRSKPLINVQNDYELKYGLRTNDDNYESKEASDLLLNVIKELPESLRRIVVLRDIDELELSEIESLTGEKIENIRVNLSRARKKIRIRLTEIYDYEYGKSR